MKYESKNLMLPKGIYKEAQATVTPKKPPKAIKNGPLKNTKAAYFRKYPDEMLLEIRWLKEFAGWTRRELVRSYGIEPRRLDNILDYSTCGDVVPYPDSFPSGHTPKNNTQPA